MISSQVNMGMPEEDTRAILRDNHKLAKDHDDSAAASAAAADLDAQAQSRRIYFSALPPIWNSLVAGPAPFFDIATADHTH